MADDRLDIRLVDLLDPARHPDARRWIEVHANVQREILGNNGRSWTLEEIQGFYRSASSLRAARAAWLDGRLVGAVEVKMPTADNLGLAMLWLSVAPDHRGGGIGTALLAEAERIGAQNGRTTFVVVTEWAEGGRDLGEVFATRHGYSIAQTMLSSEQTLRVRRDGLNGILDVDDDYAVLSVLDYLPHAWLDDRVVLQQRMSTDAPMDEVAVEEEVWDVERLRAGDARARESGRRIVESVAQHRPSGRLVAFTRISVSPGSPTIAYQRDTLVLREHRGHALGLRVKAENAALLMRTLPQVRTVRTWNAASNEPMLAVNRQLGYTVSGYSREWQKVVSSAHT